MRGALVKEQVYDVTENVNELEGCTFIHVCKENGELIASIPFDGGEFIEKDGYTVVIDHDEYPDFELKDGKIFLDLKSPDIYNV